MGCGLYHVYPYRLPKPEEHIMCGDGKESYRVPAVMYSDDLINYITSVCNECLAFSKCEIAKSFSVLDRCENFKGKEMPVIREGNAFLGSPFSGQPHSISKCQEFPKGD